MRIKRVGTISILEGWTTAIIWGSLLSKGKNQEPKKKRGEWDHREHKRSGHEKGKIFEMPERSPCHQGASTKHG